MNKEPGNPVSTIFHIITWRWRASQLRLPLLYTGLLFLCVMNVVQGQGTLPKCQDRPTWTDPPWVNGLEWCLEQVINDPESGTLGYSALAAAPDGTLYATRPLVGEVLALSDKNGDGLPESPQVVAEGLILPNGLAYYDDALYISGGPNIYRLRDNTVEVIVDDVPWGAGFWTGGLTIGPDEHIYVAIGATCDSCEMDDPARGAIWKYPLNGGEGQIVADGLRQPGDVVFRDDTLWTLDTAADDIEASDMDELNRVEVGGHYGWPHCSSADHQSNEPAANSACRKTIPPALRFPTHSNPIGLAVYDQDAFPHIRNNLLVTLHGNHNQSTLQGFAVAMVSFNNEGNPTDFRIIIPEQTDISYPAGLDFQDLQYNGSGLWPNRPIDVTVSREGWIYISVSGGRILAIRPL